MPDLYLSSHPDVARLGPALAAGPPPVPDWDRAARGVAGVLDVLARCARIAWWDGSAIGLRLDGFAGLFGFAEADQAIRAQEDRS